MKSHTLLLLVIASLSCRAETPAASTTATAAQAAPAAKSAAAPVVTTPAPAKPAEVTISSVAAVAPVKATVAQNTDRKPTMEAVVVSGSAEMKPAAPDANGAEQQASMAQRLMDETQSQKAALAGILTMEQPKLSTLKLSTNAKPGMALAPAIETKSLAVGVFESK